jgi:hypothetical protein
MSVAASEARPAVTDDATVACREALPFGTEIRDGLANGVWEGRFKKRLVVFPSLSWNVSTEWRL